MTPLRLRMIDAMVLRGFAVRTQETYLIAVGQMARHHRCSPDLLSDEQIQAYLLYLLQERHRSRSTVNITSCAMRFLVCEVLGQTERRPQIPMGRNPQRLPEVLSRAEVAALLAVPMSPKARTFLTTAYASGLRVSELCQLRGCNIDSAPDRMCIRVVQGKGGQDRYGLLTAELLDQLRLYWRTCRGHASGADWLFPARSNPSQSRDGVAVGPLPCASHSKLLCRRLLTASFLREIAGREVIQGAAKVAPHLDREAVKPISVVVPHR